MEGLGEHPRCPSCSVLMRDADGGWTCPACGMHVPAEEIDQPDTFDGPSIHGG